MDDSSLNVFYERWPNYPIKGEFTMGIRTELELYTFQGNTIALPSVAREVVCRQVNT